MFARVAFIGIGLIGSSLARVMRRDGLASEIVVASRRQETIDRAMELGLCDRTTLSAADAVKDADLVIICTPMSTYKEIATAIAPALMSGAIVTDVGSVKAPTFKSLGAALPDYVHFVPGHPIAGTEHSGPRCGFSGIVRESLDDLNAGSRHGSRSGRAGRRALAPSRR